MLTDVTGALPFEAFHVDAAAVKIQREQPTAIFVRPVVALVNHQAGVRVTAAQRIAAGREGTAVRRRA